MSDPAVEIEATSITHAATTSGVGRTLMYEEIKAGRGPRTFTIGRRRLVRVEELRRWLREREANGANPA